MTTQSLSKELLIEVFGETVVDRHIDFIKFCAGIKRQLPQHVTLDDVVKQVSVSRNYHLISNMIFVHESRLDELRRYLNKNARKSGANKLEISKALESIPTNK